MADVFCGLVGDVLVLGAHVWSCARLCRDLEEEGAFSAVYGGVCRSQALLLLQMITTVLTIHFDRLKRVAVVCV